MADEDNWVPIVPSGTGAARARRRLPWWSLVALVLAAVPPTAVLWAVNLDAPAETRPVRDDPSRTEEVTYGYAIVPGDTFAAEDRVRVSRVESFDADGEILFVTVSIPRVTWLNRLLLRDVDPTTVDLLTAKELLGDRSPDEERQANLQLMGDSKRLATYVALRRLGYTVTVGGGGVVIDEIVCEERSADGRSCVRQAPAAAVLAPGDLIVGVGDTPVHLVSDLSSALAGKAPGEVVEVLIKGVTSGAPVGPTRTVPVTLTGTPERAILGIRPKPLPPDDVTFSFPVEVGISSGQVGGPSAGLSFTLAIIDRLTPGELTGGATVAATGEIEPGGTVGEIGGVAQKTKAVLRSGASVFFVPASQVAEAEAVAAGTSLEVIGVRTLDDALSALAARGGSPLPAR
jgi:PDZ domain-containing protein